ncbi:MAG: hypothetical protein H6621_12855 [Halobacteriovoraceae bacterium]|nr:hypothetical protein [Halobacteriovoraceae bacterium]MCB9095951.1 hypothetical protein [Halobacteriovoraceae bacterium]
MRKFYIFLAFLQILVAQAAPNPKLEIGQVYQLKDDMTLFDVDWGDHQGIFNFLDLFAMYNDATIELAKGDEFEIIDIRSLDYLEVDKETRKFRHFCQRKIYMEKRNCDTSDNKSYIQKLDRLGTEVTYQPELNCEASFYERNRLNCDGGAEKNLSQFFKYFRKKQ